MAKGTNPDNVDLNRKIWRSGTHNKFLVYAVMDTGDPMDDVYMGDIHTEELATALIDYHNNLTRNSEPVNDS